MTKIILAAVGVLFCATVTFAEPPGVAEPLRDLPPDLQGKIVQLAQILAGAIQSGQLSDVQMRAALNGGDAPAMLRSLGPEATQLLQDIAAGFKGKYSEDELNLLLGGLIPAK